MKTKIIIAILSVWGFTFVDGFSQTDLNALNDRGITIETLLTGEFFAPALSPDITTYFNREWQEGTVQLDDGRLVRNVKLRYNGLLDELFWLEPASNKTIKLDKQSVLRFHFLNIQGDTSVYFRRLKVKRDNFSDSMEVFGQELYFGKISLYVMHSFYFEKQVTVQMHRSNILKDVYKEEPVYYVEFPDAGVAGFRKFTRKNLAPYFPQKEKEIRKFFSESGAFRIKNRHEIRNLIQYLD
jgi:hypothetical protein